MTILAVVIFHSLIPMEVVLGYILVSIIVAAVHECGHWLAGCIVGLRLGYLIIGPVKLILHSGQWKLHGRSQLTGGFILMSIEKVRRVRRRLIACIIGGPTASLVTGLIALAACRVESIGGSAWIGFPVAGFAILSIMAGVNSLRNIRFRGYAGDGALLRGLSTYDRAKQQIAAHALYMLQTRGLDISLWNRRWMLMASAPSDLTPTSFHRDWLQYHLSSDSNQAAECLERCLAGLAALPPDPREEIRDEVYLEAALFTARYRNDAEKAQTWFDRAVHPERASLLLQKRARIALNCARRDFGKAIAELDDGLNMVNHMPAGARTESMKASWLEWRSTIRTMHDQAVVVPE